MTASIATQPCPFCGSFAEMYVGFGGLNFMRCTNPACGLIASFQNAATPETTAARWNAWPYKAAFGFKALRKLMAVADDVCVDSCQLSVGKDKNWAAYSFISEDEFIAALVSALAKLNK